MIVAVPVDEGRAQVCVSFGRAPYFQFFDTQTGQSRILENPAAQAAGGAGIQCAQFVTDQGADVLITVRCGENAARVFQAAGLDIRKARTGSAEENLAAFQAGELEVLTHFHAGFHGGQ